RCRHDDIDHKKPYTALAGHFDQDLRRLSVGYARLGVAAAWRPIALRAVVSAAHGLGLPAVQAVRALSYPARRRRAGDGHAAGTARDHRTVRIYAQSDVLRPYHFPGRAGAHAAFAARRAAGRVHRGMAALPRAARRAPLGRTLRRTVCRLPWPHQALGAMALVT